MKTPIVGERPSVLHASRDIGAWLRRVVQTLRIKRGSLDLDATSDHIKRDLGFLDGKASYREDGRPW